MRCRFCFSRLDKTEVICKVCNIQVGKEKKDLTKKEKKVQYYCRALRVVGFLSVFVGIFRMLDLFTRSLGGIPNTSVLTLFLLSGFLSVVILVFGFAIIRYQTWCYAGGIVLFSLVILITVFEFHKFWLLLLIEVLLLSYIAAPTSKKILYREL